MSASTESFGMRHPTVVPTNFEPAEPTEGPTDDPTDGRTDSDANGPVSDVDESA